MPKDKQSIEYLLVMVTKLFAGMGEPVKIRFNDGEVSVDGIWATCCKVKKTLQTLSGAKRKELPGFIVGVTVYTPATRWEPEDWDVVEKEKVTQAWQAARLMASLYFENKIDQVLESISYEVAEDESEAS